MPRLPKAESEKYQAGLVEWTPKVLATIQELAKNSENQVKRADILAVLGEEFEDRFIIPIFTELLAAGHIIKTGASRGRGARWGIPADAPEELSVELLTTTSAARKPVLSRAIKIAGPCANLASAVMRARRPKVVNVAIVESTKDADYVADTGNTYQIKHWFLRFMQRFA